MAYIPLNLESKRILLYCNAPSDGCRAGQKSCGTVINTFANFVLAWNSICMLRLNQYLYAAYGV